MATDGEQSREQLMRHGCSMSSQPTSRYLAFSNGPGHVLHGAFRAINPRQQGRPGQTGTIRPSAVKAMILGIEPVYETRPFRDQ